MSAFNCFLCSCWDQVPCFISVCGLSPQNALVQFLYFIYFVLLVTFPEIWPLFFLFVSARLNKTITFFLLSATWAFLPRSVSLPTFSSRQPHWNPPFICVVLLSVTLPTCFCYKEATENAGQNPARCCARLMFFTVWSCRSSNTNRLLKCWLISYFTLLVWAQKPKVCCSTLCFWTQKKE